MGSESFGFEDFLSVFTWRYGSKEMRRIFSEIHYREIWRKIWVALAEAQREFGLVSDEEVRDLKSKMPREFIDLKRAHELEKKIKHDVMAELKTYAEQCPVGGGKLHLGATSMDITDNADIVRIQEAIKVLIDKILGCLQLFSEKIIEFKDLACMGWTHLQPAEPTTLGYRLSNYAQDLTLDLLLLEYLTEKIVKGKGIKGAVGTSASFKRLLESGEAVSKLERIVMEKLNLDSFTVSSQTYPRKVDFIILSTLSSIAQSAHKFAFDIRILQSPNFGELAEPIRAEQVGSSAMPFKRNPVKSERICSLARYVSALPSVAWWNASNTLLERTLDDSANRRIIIPEAFLAVDECLRLYYEVLDGLRVYPKMMEKNLKNYGPFVGTEALLMKLTSRGMNRQVAHEKLRKYSFKAWEEVMVGKENPLLKLLNQDPDISRLISQEELEEALNPYTHLGNAPERCEQFVHEVLEPILKKYGKRPRTIQKSQF